LMQTGETPDGKPPGVFLLYPVASSGTSVYQ